MRKFALYTSPPVLFLAAGAQTVNITIARDKDFVCTGLTVVELAAVPALNNYLVQVSDTVANETWFDIPAPVPAIAGAPLVPMVYYLPAARKLPMNTTVTVVWTAAAAGVGNVQLTLHGFKVWGQENQPSAPTRGR